jgi:hypothetical protein
MIMQPYELAELRAEKDALWRRLAALDAARLAWERLGRDGPELAELEDQRDEARASFVDVRERYVRLVLCRR